MNYEKRCNELIDAIKEMMEANPHDEGLQNWVHDNVPELAESEDERIRELLIRFHKGTIDIDGIKGDEIVSWLEKQVPIDKEKMLIGSRKDVASSIITYLDRNTLGMCLSNMECEDLVNAVVDSDWSKVYDYMKKKLEKQGEQKSGWGEEDDLVEKLDYDDYIRFFNEHPGCNNDSWGFDEAWKFAQYFYKLGLKAKKGGDDE